MAFTNIKFYLFQEYIAVGLISNLENWKSIKCSQGKVEMISRSHGKDQMWMER